MQDRELLEMAAKAAGIGEINFNGLYWELSRPNEFKPPSWNPLKDDGDALRLAASLRLGIIPGKYAGDGCSVYAVQHQSPGVTVFRDSKDMAEQMRWAIVMAAAEIGKAMP